MKQGINFSGADSLSELADEWDKTAALAELACAGSPGLMGEAKALRGCAKELRELIEAGAPIKAITS